MMKQPESPIDVKLHEFGRLLDAVLDASYDCEVRGLSYDDDHAFMRKYKLARERLMGAISAALQDKFDLGFKAAGGSIHPIESTMDHIARDIRDGIFPKKSEDEQPFFLTQWEREDYERQKRGEKPLGPGACVFPKKKDAENG